MKITKVKDQQIIETPHNLDVRKLYDNDSAQTMLHCNRKINFIN
jgi:hypothetical protein